MGRVYPRSESARKVSADRAKAEKVLEQFDRQAETYPYPSEIEGERELIQIAQSLNQQGVLGERAVQ